MAEHFNIVFEGQLRTGVDLETARLNLAQLFKSDVSAVDRLFSGKVITLKRNLTRDDAERYIKALNNAGVEARIEAQAPVTLSLEEIEEPVAQGPAYSVAPSPYAPPRASVSHQWPDVGQLKVFTLQGRIGRMRYLAWSLVLVIAAMIAAFACIAIMSQSLVAGGLIGAVAVVAFVVVSIQIGAQRLHDAGWSAWMLLLNLVPFVGSAFPLLMMAVPGNAGPNQYGPPQPPNSKSVKVLAWLWVVFIALTFYAALIGGYQSLKDEVEMTTGEYEQTLPYDDDSNSDSAQPADPADEDNQ